MSKNFLSAGEYAARLQVTVRRVEVLAGDGRLEGAQRVGGRWIIPVDCPDPRKPAGHPPGPAGKKKAAR